MASNSLQNNIFSGISKSSHNRSKFTSTNSRTISRKPEQIQIQKQIQIQIQIKEPKVEPTNIIEKRRSGNTVNCIFTGSFFVNSLYVPSKTRISIPINITIYGNTKLVDTLILYPSVDLQSLIYAGHDIISEDTIIIYLYNNTSEDIHDIERKWKYTAFIF
jgi:hypothetical protein